MQTRLEDIDVGIIAHSTDASIRVDHLCRLTHWLLAATLQGDHHEEYVTGIMALDDDAQTIIMEAIEAVMARVDGARDGADSDGAAVEAAATAAGAAAAASFGSPAPLARTARLRMSLGGGRHPAGSSLSPAQLRAFGSPAGAMAAKCAEAGRMPTLAGVLASQAQHAAAAAPRSPLALGGTSSSSSAGGAATGGRLLAFGSPVASAAASRVEVLEGENTALREEVVSAVAAAISGCGASGSVSVAVHSAHSRLRVRLPARLHPASCLLQEDMRLAMGARDREMAILKVQLQQAQSLIQAATGVSGSGGASLSAALLAGRPSIIGPEALSLVTRMEKSLETQKAQAEVRARHGCRPHTVGHSAGDGWNVCCPSLACAVACRAGGSEPAGVP